MAHGAPTANQSSIDKDIQSGKKLVKATELPIHGNPYPPKDVVQNEDPGFLELKVRSVRTVLQPYVSPFAVVYEKTNDFFSIGVAHSQNAIYRLRESQSSVVNSLIIATAGLIGLGLARKRGIFKKLLYGSVFFGSALVACYPKESEEKGQIAWYIARNKLPGVVQEQYQKLAGKTSPSTSNDKEEK